MDEQVHFEDVAVGREIPRLVKNCSTRQLVMWAAASGDFYEIHYDVDHARATGLPGPVVHGALKNAFLGQLLHDWIAPAGRIVRFGCSYRGMDRPGEDIVCRGVVTAVSAVTAVTAVTGPGEGLVELEIWTEDASGTVTTPGSATVALPARPAA